MIKAEHSASSVGRLCSVYVLAVFVIEAPDFVGIVNLNSVGLQAQRQNRFRRKKRRWRVSFWIINEGAIHSIASLSFDEIISVIWYRVRAMRHK